MLIGGAGEDILIAGFTLYDYDPAALSAIRAEWTRTDLDHTARIANLYGGIGVPALNETTAFYNRATGGNTLLGGENLDWFFGDPTQDPNDWDPLTEVFLQVI